MRILHTSDWHLGKYLVQYSRLPEQEAFIDELVQIVEDKNIDLIMIAGDIYDTLNPSAAAEQLFYRSMKRLSNQGKRPIIIIAGNHDSETRLTASSPLAQELGIVLVGRPNSVVPDGVYEYFQITRSGKGYFEIELKGEKAVFLTMPYPSEKRLNESISDSTDEQEIQQSYSEKIESIFADTSKNFRQDTINIAIGHFYVVGGESSKSEREIQLGGAYAVEGKALPQAQYIAMGHLHRPQKVATKQCVHAYYSGSPIQYSKSEANYAKCVFIADIEANREAKVEKVFLTNYKPIDIWQAKSIEEAIQMAELHQEDNSWVFLEVETDRVLLQSEIKQLHQLKKDIVEIFPIIKTEKHDIDQHTYEEKTLSEEFTDFYTMSRGVGPSIDVLQLFLELCGEVDKDETNFIED